MTALKIIHLRDLSLRRRAAHYIMTDAPDDAIMLVKPPTRTLPQNDKFHAICGDMNGIPWYGKARNAKQWKVLLVSGHTVATGGEVEVVPGLEGEFINIRESTALMSKARGSSLIEYAQAFAAQHLEQS